MLNENLKFIYTLWQISKSVNSELDLDLILRKILNMVIDIFKAEAGSIMLLDEGNYLTISYAVGLSEDIIKNTKVRLGDGIAGWVALHGKPLLLEGELSNDERFKNRVKREGIKSSICVPLYVKDKIIGVLMIRNHNRKFTQDDMQFLFIIADNVSLAIENARLYSEQREKVIQLHRINEELKYKNNLLETIFSNMADAIVLFDNQYRIDFVNNRFEKIFNIDKSLVKDKKINDFLKDIDLQEAKKHINTYGYFEKQLRYDSSVYQCYISYVNLANVDYGFIMILRDITYITKMQESKLDFLHMAAHDIKNPVADIIDTVNLILYKESILEDKQKTKKFLLNIKELGEKLLNIIDNTLKNIKSDSYGLILNLQEVELNEFVNEIIESMRGSYKGRSIYFEELESFIFVKIDKTYIRQVLENLIDNAMKYSDSDIYVSFNDKGEFIEIRVLDKGKGIKAEDIPKIFNKYYKEEVKEKDSKTDSYGIGLYNAKQIMQAHNGYIKVDSRFGKGSIFIIGLKKKSL